MTTAITNIVLSVGHRPLRPPSGGGATATAASKGFHVPGFAATDGAVGKAVPLQDVMPSERRRAGVSKRGCRIASPPHRLERAS